MMLQTYTVYVIGSEMINQSLNPKYKIQSEYTSTCFLDSVAPLKTSRLKPESQSWLNDATIPFDEPAEEQSRNE